jgi:hypothetical protein
VKGTFKKTLPTSRMNASIMAVELSLALWPLLLMSTIYEINEHVSCIRKRNKHNKTYQMSFGLSFNLLSFPGCFLCACLASLFVISASAVVVEGLV